jgi:hypothetical protein
MGNTDDGRRWVGGVWPVAGIDVVDKYRPHGSAGNGNRRRGSRGSRNAAACAEVIEQRGVMGRLRMMTTPMVVREMENEEEDAHGTVGDGKRRGGMATMPMPARDMVNEEEDAHGSAGDGK